MSHETKAPAPVLLGGRYFNQSTEDTLTVGQFLHYAGLYSRSGIGSPCLKPEETPEEFKVRLLGELVAAGIVLEMLGTLLIPEGKTAQDWTPDMAKETAHFIAGLTSPEDKGIVLAQVLSIVLDFFERGLVTFWTSQKSSTATKQPDPNDGGLGIATVH